MISNDENITVSHMIEQETLTLEFSGRACVSFYVGVEDQSFGGSQANLLVRGEDDDHECCLESQCPRSVVVL